jgi:hypothetical protein
MLLTQSHSDDDIGAKTLQRREGFAGGRYSRREADVLALRLQAGRSRYLRYLRGRLPSLEDAEDVLQDAMVRFTQSGQTSTPIENPDAWINDQRVGQANCR